MNTKELLAAHRERILEIAKSYGARRIRLFGSAARGEEYPDSDLDFLVELEEGHSLLDLGGMQIDLQDLLGRKVDIVSEKGVRPRIRERILKEAVPL
jgi:hypothetical protein